jgi:hypothetical protein
VEALNPCQQSIRVLDRIVGQHGVDRDGRCIIDKDHRGVAIYLRLGAISQEHAEQRLADEIARVNAELERNARPRRRFADCAARYIAEPSDKRSVSASAWHVRRLTSYIGTLEVYQIHDGTLERFVADRVASGHGHDHQS